MEIFLTKLSELSLKFDEIQHNETHMWICFSIYNDFKNFLKLFAECKMSSQLSKHIHFCWSAEFIQNYEYSQNVKNVFDVISNFSDAELFKLQLFVFETESKHNFCYGFYRVVFPIVDVEMISTHLSFLILEKQLSHEHSANSVVGEPMETCDETRFIFDDLIYSDSDDDL